MSKVLAKKFSSLSLFACAGLPRETMAKGGFIFVNCKRVFSSFPLELIDTCATG